MREKGRGSGKEGGWRRGAGGVDHGMGLRGCTCDGYARVICGGGIVGVRDIGVGFGVGVG